MFNSRANLKRSGDRKVTTKSNMYDNNHFAMKSTGVVKSTDKIWLKTYTSADWLYLKEKIVARFMANGVWDNFVDPTGHIPLEVVSGGTIVKELPENEFTEKEEDESTGMQRLLARDLADQEIFWNTKIEVQRSLMVAETARATAAGVNDLEDNPTDVMKGIATELARLTKKKEKVFEDLHSRMSSYRGDIVRMNAQIESRRLEYEKKSNLAFSVWEQTIDLDATSETLKFIKERKFRNAFKSLLDKYEVHGKTKTAHTISALNALSRFQYSNDLTLQDNYNRVDDLSDLINSGGKSKLEDDMRTAFFVNGVNNSGASHLLKSYLNTYVDHNLHEPNWPQLKSDFSAKFDALMASGDIRPTYGGDKGKVVDEAAYVSHGQQKKRGNESVNYSNAGKGKRNCENGGSNKPSKGNSSSSKHCDHHPNSTTHNTADCWKHNPCPHCNRIHNYPPSKCESNSKSNDEPKVSKLQLGNQFMTSYKNSSNSDK